MKKTINTEMIQNVLVVQITCNKLVASNRENFKSSMDTCMEQHHDILVDMTRVEYIDSSGLGSLLHCLRKTNNINGRLRLFGVNPPIMSLFKLIHLDQVFNINRNLDEALENLKNPEWPRLDKT